MSYVERLLALAEKLEARNGYIPLDLQVKLVAHGIIL